MNHKFWNGGQGKSEGIVHAVKNAELVTIPGGTPVVFAMAGNVDDGLAVVLPSSSTAAKIGAFGAGITVNNIPAGKLGEVQVYGFNRKTLVGRATRANSTSDWPTMASIALAATLGMDSTLNACSPAGVAVVDGAIYAAEALAAGPTLGSSNPGAGPASGTVFLQAVKTFLRFM